MKMKQQLNRVVTKMIFISLNHQEPDNNQKTTKRTPHMISINSNTNNVIKIQQIEYQQHKKKLG